MHEIYNQNNLPYLDVNVCPHCGYLASKDLEKCPRCGKEIIVSNQSVDEFNTVVIEKTNSTAPAESNQQVQDNVPSNPDNPVEPVEEKKPNLVLRQVMNFITLLVFLSCIALLLFLSYFTIEKANGTGISAKILGHQIIRAKKDIYNIKNGDALIPIFTGKLETHKFGRFSIFGLYLLNLVALGFGVLYLLSIAIKRKKVSGKLLGILIIPSAFLYLFSYIHSLVLNSSKIMKANEISVSTTSTHVFIALFIIWALNTFIFVKDKGNYIPKQKKSKDSHALDDDLFKE